MHTFEGIVSRMRERLAQKEANPVGFWSGRIDVNTARLRDAQKRKAAASGSTKVFWAEREKRIQAKLKRLESLRAGAAQRGNIGRPGEVDRMVQNWVKRMTQ